MVVPRRFIRFLANNLYRIDDALSHFLFLLHLEQAFKIHTETSAEKHKRLREKYWNRAITTKAR